jgi:hypothetical protein
MQSRRTSEGEASASAGCFHRLVRCWRRVGVEVKGNTTAFIPREGLNFAASRGSLQGDLDVADRMERKGTFLAMDTHLHSF